MKICFLTIGILYSTLGFSQEIKVLEYQAKGKLNSYSSEILFVSKDNSTGKTDFQIRTTGNATDSSSVLRLKATLNAKLFLIDSFIVNDVFGQKEYRGFFKDTSNTNFTNYEVQNSPYPIFQFGGVKDGIFSSWIRKGVNATDPVFLSETITYRKGRKNGANIIYFDYSKSIRAAYEYKEGNLNGDFTEYNPDGTFSAKGNYLNNELNGAQTRYYSNNQPAEVSIYEKGKLQGQRKLWHPNGNLHCINWYENDQAHGYYYTYFDNGQKKDSLFYINGKLDGKNCKFHRNGKKAFECLYNNGKENGVKKVWNEAGVLIEETGYKNGQRNGWSKLYTEEGKLYESTYVDLDKEYFETITYHPNGKIHCKLTAKDGQVEVVQHCWDEKGKKLTDNTLYIDYFGDSVGPPVLETPYESADPNEQEQIDKSDEIVFLWEDPSLQYILAPTEEGKKMFSKLKGIKFNIDITSRYEYTVTLDPSNLKSKAGKKALPMLQTAFQVSPLTINGTRFPTRLVFTFE